MHKTIAIVSATGALLFGGAGLPAPQVRARPRPQRPQSRWPTTVLVTPITTTVTTASGACSACLDCWAGWTEAPQHD